MERIRAGRKNLPVIGRMYDRAVLVLISAGFIWACCVPIAKSMLRFASAVDSSEAMVPGATGRGRLAISRTDAACLHRWSQWPSCSSVRGISCARRRYQEPTER